MIFISNLVFQTFVDEGRNKDAQHFEALMSRSLYLDLRLHNRDELGVWVKHIAQNGKIFDRENVPQNLRQPILSFLNTRSDVLRKNSTEDRSLCFACKKFIELENFLFHCVFAKRELLMSELRSSEEKANTLTTVPRPYICCDPK